MKNPRPLVSVIIPAWNAEASIGRAIGSALAQRNAPLEVIVVDDASTDRTAEIVAGIDDPRVRLIRLAENQGPGGARNAALDAVRGRWVAVLDSDDTLLPGRFERLAAGPGAGQADILIDEVLEDRGTGAPPAAILEIDEARRLSLAEFILSNRVFGSGPNLGYSKPMFRSEFLEKQGLRYDATLRIGEDFLFLATCLAAGARAWLLPEPGYLYARREGSISHRLSVPVLEKMCVADRAFARRTALAAGERAALKAHLAALERAKAFTASIDGLKARSVARAIRPLLSRPGAVALFRYPIMARLRRLRPGR